MKTAFIALVAALCCMDLTEARKTYMVKNQYQGRRPTVTATNIPSYELDSRDDGDEFSVKLKLQLALGW